VSWSKRAKDAGIGALIVVVLIVGFFAAAGVMSWLRRSSCDRLDAARLSHLEPGHTRPGPDSIYVIGVGPGPPPSQLDAYYEAEAEMERAGCAGTGRPGPGD
jgi:hypothetical protein